MSASTRTFFEPRFGRDFSQVRIHRDSAPAESAGAIQAMAFTTGQDVVCGAGQFAPESGEGKRLLAHELTHVVQQGAGMPAGSDAAPKLTVGPADDECEREADRVADDVMRMPDPGATVSTKRPGLAIHRTCAMCQEEEELCADCAKERGDVQRSVVAISRKCAKCDEAEDEHGAQTKRAGTHPVAAPASLQSYVAGTRGGGIPLPAAARAHFEERFGQDFGQVRIHNDARSARATADTNALAFATGSDIHFGAGQFQPGTPEGDRLLAHELTHTVQQTGGRAQWRAEERSSIDRPVPQSRGGSIARTPALSVQRFPSPGEILDSLEETVEDAADVAEGAIDTVGGAVSDAVDTVGEAVSDAAGAVKDTAVAAGTAVVEAGEEALDWLATEAGQLASELADALGVDVTVTANGLEIVVPKLCPIDTITEKFKLEAIKGSLMVPIGGIPIGTVVLTGEVGLVGSIEPSVAVQLGPICLEGVRILVNPITGSFKISGSVSATAALALAAEVRGGLRGGVELTGVVPIGGVPVPIKVPLVGVEGGVAGLARGIGGGKLTIGGALSAGGGTISMSQTNQLDVGLAEDLFVGAYAQLELLGNNICRIHWQPLEWHGDVASSIGISLGLTVTPGGSPSVVPTISPPTIASVPFSQIGVVLGRDGFSDDCPIKDAICEVLKALNLLPSQNGGVWNWGGPYGPGPRLAGPLDVYQKNPGIPSGAQCRGACGPDCDTCEETDPHRYTDPATGDVWEYTKFQDCNWNEGCLQHDAAFDWAAAVQGETGTGAIIMPWHMAANIECTCNNLAGNCIAWIAGLPPYHGKILFADSATLVARGGGRGLGTGSCHTDFPNAPDCLQSFPDQDTVFETWGQQHGIINFRDCAVVSDFTAASTLDCHGGPGNLWQCLATDVATGETLTISLFECICCNDDDTSSSTWTEPLIVVDPTTMSTELILELCERGLIPRHICLPFEEEMIAKFGDKGRNLDLDPDKDPKSKRRVDDPPEVASFKTVYNRLDSWRIFIETTRPDLVEEFRRVSDLEGNRERWLARLKAAAKTFKDTFRNIGETNPEAARKAYVDDVKKIEGEINDLNRTIAAWFKAKTGSPKTIEEIIEEIHTRGTELWREAWRRAILQVNRVLARLWPPAKQQVLFWLGVTRAKHPTVDLKGTVGDVDYLGSTSSGSKGPPKQNIRFNPLSFDVDAFLRARPLANYCVLVLDLKPDRGNIFSKRTDIEPLKKFTVDTEKEFVEKVDNYKLDPGDPFDVAIKMDDLPEQGRGKAATERLYKLRESLPADKYKTMVDELKAAGLLKESGTAIREELSEAELQKANEIMDKFDPPQTPAPPRSPSPGSPP